MYKDGMSVREVTCYTDTCTAYSYCSSDCYAYSETSEARTNKTGDS